MHLFFMETMRDAISASEEEEQDDCTVTLCPPARPFHLILSTLLFLGGE